MRKLMLDLLACPIDKHYPLELFEINTKEDKDNDIIIIRAFHNLLFSRFIYFMCYYDRY